MLRVLVLLSVREAITSTQSEFESHFVGLRDSPSTGFFGPGSDNLYGRPMSSYGAATSGETSEFEGSYVLPIPNPTLAKIRLHRKRSQGHIFTVCMRRPNSLKLTTLHVLKQFTFVKKDNNICLLKHSVVITGRNHYNYGQGYFTQR